MGEALLNRVVNGLLKMERARGAAALWETWSISLEKILPIHGTCGPPDSQSNASGGGWIPRSLIL
jgi:hypothetical protein